jgi:hypothetical protein
MISAGKVALEAVHRRERLEPVKVRDFIVHLVEASAHGFITLGVRGKRKLRTLLAKLGAMRDHWSAVTTFVANTADTSEATNAPTDSPRQ